MDLFSKVGRILRKSNPAFWGMFSDWAGSPADRKERAILDAKDTKY
jgi:hypothetical protein